MPTCVARFSALMIAALACQLAACATAGETAATEERERSPADPWEPLNRKLYKSTVRFDRFTFKPVAKVYQKVVPKFMQRGIGNVSNNLRSPLNIVNHFLQGKPGDGFQQTGRFILNTTIGLGGLIDVAASGGHVQKDEDFGQTLAVWGVPDGPYVIVPFLGPKTLRDAVTIPLNFLADPLFHWEDSSVRGKAYLVRAIDIRARLLSTDEILAAAYDPYIRLREAYLQNRKYEIYDGNPPEDEDFYDDFDDEIAEP